MRTLLAGLAVGALAVAPSFAQSVISAHSGVIHYTEGKILIDDKVLESKPSEFADMKANSVLRTEEGRAEVLLTPGVFLRIGEQSAVKMLSNHLSDTRVEVIGGEALVECDEILKDNAVTVVYKNTTVAVTKHGLYAFDASLSRLRVYDGEVVVRNPSGQLTAKKGQEINLNDGPLMASKFDVKVGDPLIRWASRRSGYISMANVAAARSASGYGSSYYNSGWAYNPWFGMYTFIPGAGIAYGPFGNPFWSPYASFWYAPYYSGYYGGYYGGYYPYYSGGSGGGGGSVASSFHPGARGSSSSPYSNSGTARSAPSNGFGSGRSGGFGSGGGGNSGGFGNSGGGYSAGGGFSGGSYGGGGGGGGISSGGGGGGGASVGGGGGHAGGGGGGHR
jgi:hypothetical protein